MAFFDRKVSFQLANTFFFPKFLGHGSFSFCLQLASTFELWGSPKRMRIWGRAKLGQMAKPLFPRTPWSAGARWRMQQKFTWLQLSHAFRLHHQGFQIVAAVILAWINALSCTWYDVKLGSSGPRSSKTRRRSKMFREIETCDTSWACRKSRPLRISLAGVADGPETMHFPSKGGAQESRWDVGFTAGNTFDWKN